MKRKLSFFVAVVLMLSSVPAMNVFAKTSNDVSGVAVSVATDKDWSVSKSVAGSAPVLQVKKDGVGTFKEGSKFLLTLNNATWRFDQMSGDTTDAINRGTTSEDTSAGIKYSKTDATSIAGLNYSPGVGGGLLVTSKTASPAEYASLFGQYPEKGNFYVRFTSTTTAEVIVGKNSTEGELYLPLITKLNGTGDATVTVSESDGSNVSAGTYKFASGITGSINVSVTDNKKQTSKNLDVSDIRIDETTPGKIKFGETGKNIDLTAPAGFKWDVTNAKVDLYGGFKNSQTFGSGYFKVDTDDAGIVRILTENMTADHKSEVSAGYMTVSGLRLIKDGDPVLGDMNTRVNVADNGSATVKVGEYSKSSVSMTSATGDVPQIVNGIYSSSSFRTEDKVMEITINENTKGAWNTEGTLELVPNDGVKFRGVEIKESKGFDGVGTPSLEVNPRKDQKQPSGISLTDDKFTIGGDNSVIKRAGSDSFKLRLLFYVSVRPGYTGDITISTGEDSDAFGTKDSVVVAKAIDPVTVTSEQKDVKVGYMGVELSDIIVKENVAGALQKHGNSTYFEPNRTKPSVTKDSSNKYDSYYQDVLLWIADNVGLGFYADTAKATVVSGDILLDGQKDGVTNLKTRSASNNNYAGTGNALVLNVKRASTTPSEIKISGAKIDTMRYLPNGKIDLRLGGSIVANDGFFDQSYVTGIKGFVNLVDDTTPTPAPNPNPDDDDKGGVDKNYPPVSATIGNTNVQVGDQVIKNDVAPYILNNYSMIPVRVVSEGMGLQVEWDAPNRIVTIIDSHKNRISQFRVATSKDAHDANYVTVNGSKIHFEGPPASMKDSRAFLPLRALGEIVLGLPVTWDESTRTAHINFKQIYTSDTAPVNNDDLATDDDVVVDDVVVDDVTE